MITKQIFTLAYYVMVGTRASPFSSYRETRQLYRKEFIMPPLILLLLLNVPLDVPYSRRGRKKEL